jgi:hypothetical protein
MTMTTTMTDDLDAAIAVLTTEPTPAYRLRRASEITPEQVRWLWTGRVPAGTLTVLDGDPGKGKSTLTATIAAAVTTGQALPGDMSMARGDVIFVSLEDDPAMVIVPRLIAAGADLSRVHIPRILAGEGERLPLLPDDLGPIQDMIESTAARLVIVDPLMAALSSEVNGNQDQEVRRVLAELTRIAGDTGAAIVIVRHLNKSGGGVAIYRGGGSIGIIGAARSGLLLTAHPNDPAQLLLTVSKSNLGVRPKALALRIIQAQNNFGAIEWGEEADITADDALTGTADDPDEEPDGELGAAIAWLRDALADGPLPSRQVFAEAKDEGISRSTLKRAKIEAGILSRKHHEPDPHWRWALPDSPTEQGTHDGALAENDESLGSLGSLAPAQRATASPIYKESTMQAECSAALASAPDIPPSSTEGTQEDQGTQGTHGLGDTGPVESLAPAESEPDDVEVRAHCNAPLQADPAETSAPALPDDPFGDWDWPDAEEPPTLGCDTCLADPDPWSAVASLPAPDPLPLPDEASVHLNPWQLEGDQCTGCGASLPEGLADCPPCAEARAALADPDQDDDPPALPEGVVLRPGETMPPVNPWAGTEPCSDCQAIMSDWEIRCRHCHKPPAWHDDCVIDVRGWTMEQLEALLFAAGGKQCDNCGTGLTDQRPLCPACQTARDQHLQRR